MAETPRRSWRVVIAWLWFFLGLCFSVVTVLFLLDKNARDRRGATGLAYRM